MKKIRLKKPIPFDFVLEELAPLSPTTRPMFGCISVYLDDKIVLVLREKDSHPQDNGVWIATTHEHHETLKQDFPSMRSISFLGRPETAWQVLPLESDSFEADVLKACKLILKGDPRIGKVPESKKKKLGKSRSSPKIKTLLAPF